MPLRQPVFRSQTGKYLVEHRAIECRATWRVVELNRSLKLPTAWAQDHSFHSRGGRQALACNCERLGLQCILYFDLGHRVVVGAFIQSMTFHWPDSLANSSFRWNHTTT